MNLQSSRWSPRNWFRGRAPKPARGVNIRLFVPADAEVCARIFFAAVHRGARDLYDEAQRRAWLPEQWSGDRLLQRLQGQTVFVAELDGRVLGFMSLRSDGHVDFAYLSPDSMGKGIAARLLERVQQVAAERGLPRLTVDASELALRFLLKYGWQVTERRELLRDGVVLCQFGMQVELPQTGLNRGDSAGSMP
ncbi:MAG: GNAT family N-acetyltransferase [Planctomycetota bacterium]